MSPKDKWWRPLWLLKIPLPCRPTNSVSSEWCVRTRLILLMIRTGPTKLITLERIEVAGFTFWVFKPVTYSRDLWTVPWPPKETTAAINTIPNRSPSPSLADYYETEYYSEYDCNLPLLEHAVLSATSSLRERGPENARLNGKSQ